MQFQKSYSLRKLNTFGVDAEAKLFTEIKSQDDVFALIEKLEAEYMPLQLLGGGSNILFTHDFPGLVALNAIKGIKYIETNEEFGIIEAGAGEKWHDFVEICMKNKWHGLENLALIPGTVGAAPVQNIGAYGVEQCDCFHSLTGVDLIDKQVRTLYPDECRFGYRTSIFKHELNERFVITSVRYKLTRQFTAKTNYRELRSELAKFPTVEPDAQYVFDTVCRIRRTKLPDPAVTGNAGSFFKNPVVTENTYTKLKLRYPEIPFYPVKEKGLDLFKLSAGWLIEQCGLKGMRKGSAGVSERHALILINHGSATGADIAAIARIVISKVKNKFGIKLDPEVIIL